MPPLFFNTNTNALIAKSVGNNQLVLTECCCPTILACVDCNFDTLAVTFSGFAHSSNNFSWCNVVNGKTFYLRRSSQASVNQDIVSDTCIWQYTIPCGPLLLLTITGNTTMAFTIGGTILSITKKLTDAKTPQVSPCVYSLPKPGLPAATTPPYEDFTREGDCYTNGMITIGSANNNSINPETRCPAGTITTTISGTETYSVQTNYPDVNGNFPTGDTRFPPLEGPVFHKQSYYYGGVYEQVTIYPIDGTFNCLPAFDGYTPWGGGPAILGLEKTDDQNSTAKILEKVNHAPTDIFLGILSYYAENIADQVVGTFTTIDGGPFDIQWRGFYNNNTTYTDGDVVYTYINSEIRYRYIDPINNSVGNSPPSNKWVVVPTINTSACTYTLVAGFGDDDNGSFTISANQLIASIPFNYEVKNSYKIRIRSTDNGFYESGEDTLYLEKTFTIPVYNTNEAPTEIFLTGPNDETPSSVFSVLENVSSGVLIGTFSMSDPDSPPNLPALPIQSRIQYIVIDYAQTGGSNGSDYVSFTYNTRNNQDQLELRTGDIFNRETKSSYTLALIARDSGSLSTPVKIFTINILENNEAPINITLNHDYLWNPDHYEFTYQGYIIGRYEIEQFYPGCSPTTPYRIPVATISVSDPDGSWPPGPPTYIFGDSNVITLSNNDKFEVLPDSMILYIKAGVVLTGLSTNVTVTDSSIVPQNQKTVTCTVSVLAKNVPASRFAIDTIVNTIDKDTPCTYPMAVTGLPNPYTEAVCIRLANFSSNATGYTPNVVYTNSNNSVFTLYAGGLWVKGIVTGGSLAPGFTASGKPNLAPGDYTTTITRYDPDASTCYPNRPNIPLSVTFTLHVLGDDHLCCGNTIYGYSPPANNQTISSRFASYPNPNDHSLPISSGTSIGIGVGANLKCITGCNMGINNRQAILTTPVFDTIVTGGSVSNIHVVKHGSGFAKACHTPPISADLVTTIANSAGVGLNVQYTFNNPSPDINCTNNWKTISPCGLCDAIWSVKRDATTSGVSVINGGTGYAQNQTLIVTKGTNTSVTIPIQGNIDVINLIPEISAKATSGSGGIATFTPTFEGYTPQTLPNNTNVRFWKIPSLSLISSNATDFAHNDPIMLTLLNGTISAGAAFVFAGRIKITLSAPILKIRNNTTGTGATFVVNGSLNSSTGYYTITSIDISNPGSGYSYNDMDDNANFYLSFNNVEVQESSGFSYYDFSLNEETGAFEVVEWYGPTYIRCKGPIVNTEVTNVGAYYKPTSIVQWVNLSEVGSLYSLGNSESTAEHYNGIMNKGIFDCAPCASMQPNAEVVVDLDKTSPTYGGILSVNVISGGTYIQASSGYDWVAGMQLGESAYGSYIYLAPPHLQSNGIFYNRGVGGSRSNFPYNCPPSSWPTIPVWHIMRRYVGGNAQFDHDPYSENLSPSPYTLMTGSGIQVMYNNYVNTTQTCGTFSNLGLDSQSQYYIHTGITMSMSWSGS